MIESIQWDGRLITKPCVVKGMPLKVYHSQCTDGPSVSSTNLRRCLEANGGSPLHFHCEWSGNPQQVQPDEEKAHFVLGRALHHYALGEKLFSENFAIRPTLWDSWRTNDAKAWRDAQQAAGRSVLTDDDANNLVGMVRALYANDLVNRGILGGMIERSIFWRDEETGLFIKVRPDAIPTVSGDFCDLKTTPSVQYSALNNAVREYAYHQQAALVAEGCKRVLGVEFNSFTFLFVEKKPPYAIAPLVLKAPALELAHKQNRTARLKIAQGLKTGKWPSPRDGHIVSVDVSDRYRGDAMLEVQGMTND
jgi:hypothetical protein